MKTLKYIGIFLLSIFLVLSAIYGFFMITGSIYPGVMLENKSLAFKTEREIINSVNEYQEILNSKTITVLSNETKTTLNVGEVVSITNIEELAKEAVQYGRTGTIVEQIQEIIDIALNGRQVTLSLIVNEEVIKQSLQQLADKSFKAPTARKYVIKDGNLLIDTGTLGSQVDISLAASELSERIKTHNWANYTVPYTTAPVEDINLDDAWKAITTEPADAYYDPVNHCVVDGVQGVSFDLEKAKTTVNLSADTVQSIPLVYTEPTIKANDLESILFVDTLGSYTTYFNAWASRGTNIKLCAESINGIVIQPGEEFSFNDNRDEATIEAGYKEATVFINGKAVPGIGGGVCQVSSTLYVASLYADMDITERHNHGLRVSYVDIAWDATVYSGSLDFKFKNNTDYPIRVEAFTEGGALTIRLVGTKTTDKSVSLYSEVTKTTDKYIYAKLYKTVTENGESYTVTENNSQYKIG